jgi:peptide chain release factor subunit 3
MSKLNPGAFEFVPGKGLVLAQGPPQIQHPPVQRPEQTEAPPPPPTISLNIGGAKSTPTVPHSNPVSQPQSHSSTPQPPATNLTVKPHTSATKTFTTEKSKSDTNTIAQEVRAVADNAVLEDLYGDGNVLYSHLRTNLKNLLSQSKNI